MISRGTFLLAVSAALMFPLVASGSVTHQQIDPLRTEVYFSRTAPSALSWSAEIKSKSGATLYVLTLEPDYAVGDYLVSVWLVLREAASQQKDDNLLWPCKNCHGLQPFMFVARDLERGPQESVFGTHRNIVVRGRNIVVKADILDAKVSPSSVMDDQPQLDVLDLSISVENLGTNQGSADRSNWEPIR